MKKVVLWLLVLLPFVLSALFKMAQSSAHADVAQMHYLTMRAGEALLRFAAAREGEFPEEVRQLETDSHWHHLAAGFTDGGAHIFNDFAGESRPWRIVGKALPPGRTGKDIILVSPPVTDNSGKQVVVVFHMSGHTETRPAD